MPTVMVSEEMPQRRQAYILLRGDFLQKGDKVEPDVPAALPPLPKDAPRNRLSLAQWLVSADQPLTGRVTVNRLWAQMFGACLRGHRYDWVVGWRREQGEEPGTDVEEYLEHHDSIAIGQVHVPRWVAYGGSELAKHLDVLVHSLNDVSVVVRLANDLATIYRERDQPGQNNLLMYDVSAEWVQDELANRMAAVRQRLAPLLADDYLPAVGLVRLAEWCVGFYALQDLRVTTALSQPAGRTGV